MKSFLFPLFLLLSTAISGQSVNCKLHLHGKIVDADNEVLPGATIQIKELAKGSASDVSGEFHFENICPGKYTLVINYLGYETVSKQIDLKKSETISFILSPDHTLLSEVVVQDRYDHISKTQSTSVLTGAALDANRAISLGKALKSISGVNSIQTGPAIFKPVIHGVHSQRILILNNGVRHEGQQWGAEHAPEIDPFLASNIVVIKDASAIKYGTDALGGVVIVNPGPLPTKPGIGGSINSIYQSNGQLGIVSGLLEGAIDKMKGLSWRVHVTKKKAGDFSTPAYSLTNTGLNELNFSTALGYHKSENVGIELFYSHFSTEIGILKGSSINTIDDLINAYTAKTPQYTSAFSYSINPPRQQVSHDLIKLNAHRHSGINTYSIQYAFQNNHRQEFDLRRTSLTQIPSLDLTLYTQTLDAEWEMETPRHHLSCIGINAFLQKNNNNPNTQRLPFIPNFSNYTGGFYTIQKLKKETWEVEAGIRYDYRYTTVAGRDYSNQVYESTLHFGNVSATAGFTKNIRSVGSVTTGLSTSWRPPHVSELYSIGTHQSAAAIEFGLLLDETTNNIRDLKSVNYKNEKVYKWVNTFQVRSERMQTEISAYASYIKNYIFLRPEGITKDVRGTYPFFRYRQTDASFTGVDVKINYNIISHVSAAMKASILRASDVRNKYYLLYIPSNRASFSIKYEQDINTKLKNLFIEADVQYVGKQNRAPRVLTPQEFKDASIAGTDLLANDQRTFDFAAAPADYMLCSVSSGFSWIHAHGKTNLVLSCENLLNVTYREYTNRMRYFANDLGRSISVSIKHSF